MATIRRIDNIEPIEGADKIVRATVGGWQLVTAITNGFQIGDLVVYLEIDSWVSSAIAPFLTKPGHFPKTYNGVEGEKLKTVKLRGQISQGLILPLGSIPGFHSVRDGVAYIKEPGIEISTGVVSLFSIVKYREGDDVTKLLGIQKYEQPMDANLAGMAKGNFPSRIFKTDQERIQNLKRELVEYRTLEWEITEKLEGSSMTVYILDDVFGCCSRNLDLKETEGNTFWDTARKLKLEEKIRSAVGFGNIALQGELIGPGISGGIYKISTFDFRVFDVFLPDTLAYMKPEARRDFCKDLDIPHVPVLQTAGLLGDATMEELIADADGRSLIGDTRREGIVYKSADGTKSFKIISNDYLARAKD